MFKLSKSSGVNFAKLQGEAKAVWDDLPPVKRYRRRRRIYKIIKYLNIAILLLFFLAVIFFGTYFLTFRQVYLEAIAGKENIEEAVSFIKKQDFRRAMVLAEISNNNFNSAIFNLDAARDNFFIKYFSFLEKQINDIEYLLVAADFLSRSVSQGANFGQELENLLEGDKKLSFTKFTLEEKKRILGKIYESSPELNGMKANLDLALINLEQIGDRGILRPLKDKIALLEEYLNEGRDLLEKAVPMSQILPSLAGYPQKANYLVILQNNDELRPTGGFIGTYGLVEMEYGEILKFETHDIYHLDMPSKDKFNIAPPEALKKYLGVDKWFMRDANWSPDWPIAARRIEWFYKTESRLSPDAPEAGKFNGIIAITPEFINDLLFITGPIIVDGVEYNKDNFKDLLQYKVEKGYMQLGVSSWQRKEVIGEIAKKLKIKLFDLPSSRWGEVIDIVGKNIVGKNVLVYLKDNELQNLIRAQGWGGEVKKTEGDYLMVVDANMAALKTDAAVSRNINYKVEQDSGGFLAKLRINYAHHGNFDWKTTRYRTYTRVYAPLGSQLVKSEGFSEGEVEIINELGKTSFGCFISIEPGEIGSLYLEYRLPEELNNLANIGYYNLYIQKQPGSNVGDLAVDLNFTNAVKSYHPASLYSQRLGDNQISWNNDLSIDREYLINF